jgi:hypothetical protein
MALVGKEASEFMEGEKLKINKRQSVYGANSSTGQ